jgi:hypothetical protein
MDTSLVPGWPKGKLRVIYKQSRLPIYHKSLDWDAFFAEYPVPDVFERTVYRWPREKLRAFQNPPWRRAKMQDQCVISEIGAQPGLMRRSKERYLSDLSEREQRNGGLGQSWGPQQHLLPQPLPS